MRILYWWTCENMSEHTCLNIYLRYIIYTRTYQLHKIIQNFAILISLCSLATQFSTCVGHKHSDN